MRSSSLTTTILKENGCENDSVQETTKENTNQQPEKRSTPVVVDTLVFKTSKLNPNSSYWTVTDRQAEWYKLTIPLNQTTNTNSNNLKQSLSVPCRLLPNVIERRKSNLNINDQNEEIVYVISFVLQRNYV